MTEEPTRTTSRLSFQEGNHLYVVLSLAGGEREAHLPKGGEIVIGRSRTADLCIDDSSISRLHARIVHRDDRVLLADLGSSNGSFVDDERVGSAPVALAPGNRLRFGTVRAQILAKPPASRAPSMVVAQDFDIRAEVESARCRELGRPLAIVTVHLLHRRHSALAATRQYITACLQAEDTVAVRKAGQVDILLPGRSLREVQAIAARIHRKLGGVHMAARLQISTPPGCGFDSPRPPDADVPGDVDLASAKRRIGAREIIVADAAMVRALEMAEQFARLPLPVLITGETGTGKEILGEAIHTLGPRAAAPLVKINCAAIPESLLESELFGHERGAFSGAVAAKPGLIESAHGGTMFLDEIGEMPLALQAKLLRVVESGRVQRLGAVTDRSVDVRFVAATHRDMQAAIQEARFRSDLFFRLAALQIRLPPLRERPREIGLLARTFADETAIMTGRAAPSFTEEAERALRTFSWPGNVRELRNVISQAVVCCRDDTIALADLALLLVGPPSAETTPPGIPVEWDPSADGHTAQTRSLGEELHEVERGRILEALKTCSGNQTMAAERLGMPRRTLVSRMSALGIPTRRQARAGHER